MAHLRRERLIGVGLVVLSALAWSLNGLYTRLLTVDVWTTLAGRAISAVIMIGIVLLIKHLSGFRTYETAGHRC